MTKNTKFETTLCALVIALLLVACGKAEPSILQSTIVSVTDTPAETPSPSLTPTFTPSPTMTPSLTPTPTDTPTSTPSPTPEELFDDGMYDFMECIHYNPETLEIIDLGEQGYRLVDGDGVVVVPFLDDMEDANQALQLATLYKQNCIVGDKGNNNTLFYQFWQESSGLESELPDAFCLKYNNENLWVKHFPDRGVYGIISEGEDITQTLFTLIKKDAAVFGVEKILPDYNQGCIIGAGNERPNVFDYMTLYFILVEDN